MRVLLEVQMTKKEFIQTHAMAAYERLITEATEVVNTTLTMRIAVNQVERAWSQLTDLGYGSATKITSAMHQQVTTNTDPMVSLDDGLHPLLDNGLHQNKSVEYWTKKLKEAQGNPNFDHRDQTEIRTALTSAEISEVMGFGYYKE